MEKSRDLKKSRPKILIVDDDLQIQSMLQQILEKKDIACETASSAKEALFFIEAMPSIKLVLLDIAMPEITGIELLKMIQKVTPSVHVIMITGLTDIATAEKCMQLGAKDYITKPFDMDYLETSVLAEIIPLL